MDARLLWVPSSSFAFKYYLVDTSPIVFKAATLASIFVVKVVYVLILEGNAAGANILN